MNKYNTHTQFPDIWISKIPAHWQVHKMKRLFAERSEKGYPNEPLLVASQSMGVVPKNVYGNRTVEAQKDLHLLKLVCVGDFVISLRSFQGGLEYAYYQGIISPAYTILIPHEPMSSSYFRYLAKSKPFIGLLTLCVTGIREGQNIDYAKLKNHFLPVPPREEQDQIVRFLDWKVSSINKLIAVKQKQIANLNEMHLSVMNDLATHGIVKERNYVKTSMDWACEIPAEWSISRIRNHFEILKRIAGAEGYDVFSVTQQGLKVRDINVYEGQLAANYSGYQFVYPGEFAMNHMDLLTGGVGIADHLGVTSPDYRVFRIFDEAHCYAPYYLKVFQICYRRHAFYRFGRGAANVGRWRLPADAFKNFEIPLPPYEEQIKIVQAIGDEEQKTKAAIECLKKQIDLLNDLKTRLISDTVTGKIDVRSIEIPEYEYVDENIDNADENLEQGADEPPKEE
jgi:type I restriction enzyme S subunit